MRILTAFLILISVGQLMGINVRVYSGPGTTNTTVVLSELKRSLQIDLQKKRVKVDLITSSELLKGDWLSDTNILVIPGGRDLPYCNCLNGRGNELIREFVENGGAYLGLCAGGYYAGSSLSFAEGTPIEVTGKRELDFFPGRVVGPVYPLFDYYSGLGSRLAPILWIDEKEKKRVTSLFYKGGGYFEKANDFTHQGVSVLASYHDLKLKADLPAVVEIVIKKGKAILTGIHPEYGVHDVKEWQNDIYMSSLLSEMEKFERERRLFLSYLLKRLLTYP